MEILSDGVSMAIGPRKDRPRRTRTPETAPETVPETAPGTVYAVGEHTIDEVKEYVGGDSERAAFALEAELASDEPRKSLVEWLESRQGSGLL